MASEARPFIMRSVEREFTAGSMRSDFIQSLIHWKQLFAALPLRATQIIDRTAEGNLRIIFKHEGLEGPFKDIDRSANRLSFALIASATAIASALILNSGVGPKWHGYPLIGIAGFVISLFFGIWLMVSILRAGKLW